MKVNKFGKMEQVYKTITTSKNHRENGRCDKKDFGSITLNRVSEEEAPLICNIKDFQLNQNLRFYKGEYYKDNEINFLEKNKQGRLSAYTAIRLMILLRKKSTEGYSYVHNKKFILVGKRIFEKWCKKSELCITQTGNLTFSSWWTLDVEPIHINKSNKKFNKNNFERELKKAKEYYNKYRNKNSDHDHLSYPRIKWFNEALIK